MLALLLNLGFAGGGTPGATMTTALNPIGIGSIPNDQTGDEPRAGFTKIKSDHSNFLAAIGRRPTNPGTFGTTTAVGTTTTLNDASQNWTPNQFVGQTVTIVGPGPTSLAGYSGTITANTSTTITIGTPFPSATGSGLYYDVSPSILVAGSDGFATAAGGVAPNTVVDGNQSWTANEWEGDWVTFLSGVFAGQSALILSNTNNTLTFASAWATAIAAGTPYVIGAPPQWGSSANATVSVTAAGLPSTEANYIATGEVAGVTNRLLLGAASGGTTFSGMVAPPFDGFQKRLYNTSLTDPLNFLHLSGLSSSANQFSLENAAPASIPPNGGALIEYVSNKWKFLS
jgi:hypothetical protein